MNWGNQLLRRGRGHDRRGVLRGHGRLPPAQVALFAADVADQLAARHERGLAYGALTPDTIAVDTRWRRPSPVLREAGRPDLPTAADLPALGRLITELLDESPDPDDPVLAIARDCLTAEPAAAQVAGRLRHCARDLLLRLETGQPELPRAAAAPAYVPGPPPEPPAPQRKRRGRAVVVATTAVALVLAAAGVVLAVTRPGSPPPAGPPRATTTSPAKPRPVSLCSPGDCAARLTVTGGHLNVCDNKADGHSAVASYRRSDQPDQNLEAWANKGAGSCVDQDVTVPRGVTVTVRVCTGEFKARRYLACSDPTTTG